MSRKCFLKCLLNSHDPLPLVHNVETLLGRSKITKIKDQTCSRHQLSLKANCDDCTVELKQVGINTSGFDGFAMTKDAVYKVGHGTRVEVLLNKHIQVIEFDPPPEGYKKIYGRMFEDGYETDQTERESLNGVRVEVAEDTRNDVDNEVMESDPPPEGYKKISGKRKSRDDETEHTARKSLKMDGDKRVASIEEAAEDTWDDVDNGKLYVFTSKGVKSSNKIAAFDMDGTLIQTKSGKVYPENINDWKIAFPTVSQKLKDQISQGFKVIILSNQAPIGNGRVKIEDFKKKIEAIVTKLGVPIQVYIATGKGFYRKPSIGMWKVLTDEKNENVGIDMAQSFYCGDAAGRADKWAPGKKKDHSMADKLMAENLDLKFYTPEQFFLGHSIANVPMNKPEFNPKEYKSEPFNEQLISKEKELLVLVGFPGSGKSFLAKQIEKKSGHQYVTVCRDVLGSWQKCAAEATKLLQRGKSVIVDSTNPDKESRARWTALARDMKVPCRCANMATSFAHARHNNKFRELMKMDHVPVADMVFHTYKKKFETPSTKEGFKEVIEVKISVTFDDEEAEKIYKMHLLEK